MSAKHTYEILWRSQAIDKTYLEHRELVLLESSTLLIQVVKIERGHHVPLPLNGVNIFLGQKTPEGWRLSHPYWSAMCCHHSLPFWPISLRILYASYKDVLRWLRP